MWQTENLALLPRKHVISLSLTTIIISRPISFSVQRNDDHYSRISAAEFCKAFIYFAALKSVITTIICCIKQ